MAENSSENYTYLDYAAMAPLCKEALDAMRPYLVAGDDAAVIRDAGMNPNSLHSPGRNAFKVLEAARKSLAQSIGAERPSAVHFTSGATEADNAAVFGIARAVRHKMEQAGDKRTCKVVTSAIEHDAVLNAFKALEREGFEVVYLQPDRDGFIEVRALEAVLDDVAFVSIQAANSEIGSIQPIEKLCDVAHKHGALFHTDATQALGKMPINVARWGVDAASFSSHKVYGPKGTGALYLVKDSPFWPQLLGGGQENGKRSGTQDVCSAAGFAAAAKVSTEMLEDEAPRLRNLRDKLYRDLSTFEQIQPTVDVDEGSLDYLPNIANVLFDGYESETLVLRFDKLGFAVSGASACSSKSDEPSHVLQSMRISKDEALGSLRISMGRFTTSEHINDFLSAVPKVLNW